MGFILSTIIAASALLGAPQEKQVAWPSADAVAKARSDVAELYGDRLAKAKKPCDKTALGAELLKVAAETSDDPAAQFTLYYTARNLGIEAKDWALTMAAVAAIVDRFKIDGPAEPAEQVRRGDAFWDEVRKKKTATERLTTQLEAAEWYMRAKQHANGLQTRIADRRLADVAKSLGWEKTARRNWVRIVNRESGLALGVRDEKLVPGTDILQWDSPATATDTHWFLEKTGTYCRIVNRKTGQCLTVANGSKDQGHWVCQWPGGNPESLWIVEPRGEGFFRLTNRNSGFCLDMPNPKNKGSVAIQWASHGGPNQQWRFDPVEAN